MGKWFMDHKGHVIAHENDYGDVIIDDKKAFSGSGDYPRANGGGLSIHLPGNTLFFAILLATFFFGGILVLLSWILFATWFAIVLTVIFVATLVTLGVLMFLG